MNFQSLTWDFLLNLPFSRGSLSNQRLCKNLHADFTDAAQIINEETLLYRFIGALELAVTLAVLLLGSWQNIKHVLFKVGFEIFKEQKAAESMQDFFLNEHTAEGSEFYSCIKDQQKHFH